VRARNARFVISAHDGFRTFSPLKRCRGRRASNESRAIECRTWRSKSSPAARRSFYYAGHLFPMYDLGRADSLAPLPLDASEPFFVFTINEASSILACACFLHRYGIWIRVESRNSAIERIDHPLCTFRGKAHYCATVFTSVQAIQLVRGRIKAIPHYARARALSRASRVSARERSRDEMSAGMRARVGRTPRV